MTQTDNRVNLLDLDREGLVAFCEQMGEKRFRAIQLLRWIHRHCVGDFEKMTDLAKSFRAKLIERTEIRAPSPIWDKKSADGTRKYLMSATATRSRRFLFRRMIAERFVCPRKRVVPWGAFFAQQASKALTEI